MIKIPFKQIGTQLLSVLRVVCPACEGTGYDTYGKRHENGTRNVDRDVPCSECGGKGVVTVRKLIKGGDK